MEVVATLSGKFTKFVFVFLFVFAWEFVTHHCYVIQACLPLFACQQCDHWKSELIDRFFRLQPFCHNFTKYVSFSSGDRLSLVLALFPSYPLHGSVWTQTRPHLSITIVPTGVFVYLSLLLFSQSVTIRWFWEPSFYLLSPLQAWPWFDLTVLCENPTKLRLRNYFLSFAVGARPKNFWKDKAKWVFPKKKKAE